MTTAQEALAALIRREDLSRERTRALFDAIMAGQVEPALLAAILGAWATKGESSAELAGAVEAMRGRFTPIRTPPGVEAIDTCGTGGDGKPLFNVSTAAGIVAAAAGAVVAKHGNHSHARPSGSAEGIAALGVNTHARPAAVERCLRECRIAFLYAPLLHPAMKTAAPIRKALAVRTIFNLVGPLTNPAGVRRQLMGVSRPEHVPLILEALRALGSQRALVVHGREGLCDVSIGGTTMVGRLDGDSASIEEWDAASIGVPRAPLDALCVSSPAESADRILGMLAGERGPVREMVVVNAAAALWVANVTDDWGDGAALAREAIDVGAARATLERWRAISNADAD